MVTIEDGFLRSSGLGAAFAPPRSLVFDRRGIYYDPSRASDLEQLLANSPDLDTGRGAKLRQAIVAAGLTKYNLLEQRAMPELPAAAEKILVIGQVDDDAAVDSMRAFAPGATGNINRWLLAEARRRFPNACIIFKPHPDVERMSRAGAIAAREDKLLADFILPSIALNRLLPVADRIVTFGSLAGFEALLRGKTVTVLGLPFYAGWGLTEDALSHPRRGTARGIDELAAAALLHYPRYWDPESNLACPPEVVVARLARATEPQGARALAMTLAGRSVSIWRRLRNAAIRARKKASPDHPRPT
jgi:capsular polysaccharide export protein